MRRNASLKDQYVIRQLHRAERIPGNFGTPISIAIALLLSFLAVQSATAQIVPMASLNTTCGEDSFFNLYLNDLNNGYLHTLKDNCLKTHQFANLNLSNTMAVFVEWLQDENHSPVPPVFVRVYSLETNTLSTIRTQEGQGVAFFDSQDRIVFIDEGILKRMDAGGNNVEVLAARNVSMIMRHL